MSFKQSIAKFFNGVGNKLHMPKKSSDTSPHKLELFSPKLHKFTHTLIYISLVSSFHVIYLASTSVFSYLSTCSTSTIIYRYPVLLVCVL